MNRQQIGLKLVLDTLGVPVAVGSFEERLTIQKSVYLAQAAGVDLGYYFRWYIRGPYCSDTANDAFTVVTELKEAAGETSGWSIDEKSKKYLQRIRPLFKGPRLARNLELLASVHFLITRNHVPVEAERLRTALAKADKHFMREDVQKALAQLSAHELLSNSCSAASD